MAVTAKQLIEGFRERHGREPDRSEREQILAAAFRSQYDRPPTDEQAAAIKRAAATPFPGANGEYSPVQKEHPATVNGQPPVMVNVDPKTGEQITDFGEQTVTAPPVSPVRLRPHRKLYAGGAFQDALDFLSTGNRASAALVGSVVDPQKGGYLDRYRNPDTSYGSLLDELAPNADKTRLGRVATGVGGFVGDVLLDPTTYVAVGALGKLGKVAKAGEEVPAAVRALAKAGTVALDPIGAAAKPVGALARKVPAVAGVMDNIAERAATRNAAREILREERRAMGARAMQTGETALELQDTAKAVARRGATATEGGVRAGVKRVIDQGYDAARLAEDRAARGVREQVRVARRELTIPARTKAARTEGKLAATSRAAEGADALFAKMQQQADAARQRLGELTSARDALKQRLGAWTEARVGKTKGAQDAAARLSKQYMGLSDKLEASDKAIQDLTDQIGKQHEALGSLRVSGKNLADMPSSPGRDAVSAFLEAHGLKAEARGSLGDALDRLEVEKYLRKQAGEDPGSIENILRQVTERTANANPYYNVTPAGKAGSRKVSVYSIGDLTDQEQKAFRAFLSENGGDTSRAYATRASRSANPDNPTVVRGSAPDEFDEYIPVAEVRDALRNYRAKQRGSIGELNDAAAAARQRYQAARDALRNARTPFDEQRLGDQVTRGFMDWDRTDALEEIGRLTAQRDKAVGEYKALTGKAREVAKSFNSQAQAGKLHLDADELKNLTGALAEHERVLGKVAETRGQLAASESVADRTLAEAHRLAVRRDKLVPVVQARQQAAKAARETVFGKGARAARRAAIVGAGDAAKAPAMDAAISGLRADLGLNPEGEGLLRGAVAKVQQAGNQGGEQLAAAGILNPETVARNKDVYLKRLYDQRTDPDAYLQSLRDDPLAFLSEEARQHGAFAGGRGANPVRRPTLRRKDLDLATREGLGQVEDFLPAFLRQETETGAALARKNTLDALAAKFATPVQPPAAAAASVEQAPRGGIGKVGDWLGLTPNRMVQVPDEAKYGALRGQYVPHEALQTFDRAIAPFRLTHTNPTIDLGLRGYDKALNIWKAAKVPFNPPTRIANRVANWARAYAEEGVDPLTYIRYAHGAANDIRGEGALASGLHGLQRALGQEVPRGTPSGAFRLAVQTDPVFHGGLMGPGYDEALRNAAGEQGGLFGGIRKGLDYVGRGYGKAETTDKLGLFKLFIDRGDTAQEAADKVRRTLFDYAEAPYGADLLAKTGVMPFARYPFLAVPAEAGAFRANPGRYATAAKALQALQREGDDTDGTRGYEEQTMTGYQRGNAMLRMPGADEAGRSRYLDITRFLPAGALLNTSEAVRSLNPLTGNPFLSLGVGLTANKDTFTGQDISNEDLPQDYRRGQIASHVLEDLLPSLAPGGIYWNQLGKAVRGDRDSEGVPVPFAPSLLRYTTGLTLRPVTAGRNLDLRDMELQRRADGWRQEIQRAARRGQDTVGLEQRAQMDIDAAMRRNDTEIAR
jgi:hypothetical protein